LKNTIVINLFGGPGISKSTTAAGIFSLLKLHGVDCELVTEFAKDLTWEERQKTLKNQIYIFGKQNHRLWRLNNHVDIIITDSPLLLSLVYDDGSLSGLTQLIKQSVDLYTNYNFLLKRVKPYNPNGRSQTEEQAREIDDKIKVMLDVYANDSYKKIDGDHTAINKITANILNSLKITQKYFIEIF
jgi:hypothetical protein